MVLASLAIFLSLLATHLQSNQLHLALIGSSSNLMGTDFSQMGYVEMRRESKDTAALLGTGQGHLS